MDSTADTPTKGQPHRRLRRLWRAAWRLCLAAVAASVLAVVVFRFVPPPVSGVMAERVVDARLHGRPFRLDYRWVPRRDIAPALPLAVIAAEDQRFFLHHGWDREAIRDAMEEAERGRRLRGGHGAVGKGRNVDDQRSVVADARLVHVPQLGGRVHAG